MNEKISLRMISDQMSAIEGCSASESQAFVKTLFSTVTTHLCHGNSVDLDGIGVFSPAPNVQNPIKFCVDPKLAGLLNAPFAFFEAVSIGDDISTVDIEKIEAPEMPVIDDDRADQSIPVSQDDSKVEEKREDDGVVKPVVEDEILTEPDSESEPLCEAMHLSEIDIPTDEPEEEVLETADEPKTEAESETSGHEEDNTCMIADPIKNVVDERSEPNDVDNSVIEQTTIADDDEATIIPEDEEEFIEYYPQPKTRFWPGFIVGLIVGLVLAALAFVWYVLFYVGTPQ